MRVSSWGTLGGRGGGKPSKFRWLSPEKNLSRHFEKYLHAVETYRKCNKQNPGEIPTFRTFCGYFELGDDYDVTVTLYLWSGIYISGYGKMIPLAILWQLDVSGVFHFQPPPLPWKKKSLARQGLMSRQVEWNLYGILYWNRQKKTKTHRSYHVFTSSAR